MGMRNAKLRKQEAKTRKQLPVRNRRQDARNKKKNDTGLRSKKKNSDAVVTPLFRLCPSPQSFVPFGGNEFQTDINQANIVVLPLCYEKEPSYGRTGSRRGPFHILDGSVRLECLDEETFTEWGGFGIHTMRPLSPSSGNPGQAMMRMKQAAENILASDKFLLSIGGDHAISLGPIMAAAALHPDVGVLQVDAHLDLRNEWNGNKYSHACVMRRVRDDVKVPVTQVGIRSFSPEEAVYIRQQNITPFYAHDIISADDSWIDKVVDTLPEKVYMTIDLDGLDPSVVPGVSTPEPGGLSYRQLLNLIKAVGQRRKVIAADINELVKIRGTHVSEVTAAKIATKIFVYCWH